MDVDSKKKPKVEANSGKKPVVSAMDAAWERAEEEEKKLEESGSETPMALTPEDREEEELADVVYPSMYPVAQPLQLQWKRFRAELNRLQAAYTEFLRKGWQFQRGAGDHSVH